jgi:hypothetical protein
MMVSMSKASPEMKTGFLMRHRRALPAQILQGRA